MRGDIRVGSYLVQARLNRVVTGDQKLGIEPKVMDVLVFLVEHRGEVCSKEQILSSVWANTFVTDDVLKHAVFELRKVFGDDAQNPAYIRTIARRGYQLIAEVSDCNGDRYQIVQKLGEGAMGEVWLAQDRLLGREVALKFLPEDVEDEESTRLLLREARAAAALNHPFICKVYDTGQLDGRSFIVMEFVHGPTLKDRLVEGPLTSDETIRLGCEVAEAMEEASQKGFIHRDLKPANIILSDSGHLKIMDFGLAKRVISARKAGWDVSGSTGARNVGTLPYMSPEQVREENLDTRSDIFSLGVVLYEALTGMRLFLKASPIETGSAILTENPPHLKTYLGNPDLQLGAVLSKMLAKEPESRYQSFSEVRNALECVGLEGSKGLTFNAPSWKIWGMALAALLLIVGLVVLPVWTSVDPSALVPPLLKPEPLITLPGDDLHPALSPDGRKIAYVSCLGGECNIFVKQIGKSEGAHVPLTHSGGDFAPVWAPGGDSIFFVSRLSEESGPAGDCSPMFSVNSVPELGGTIRSEARVCIKLIQRYATPFLAPTRDGKSIVVAGHPEGERGRGLFLISLETQEVRQLTYPPESGVFDLSPSFSPDGSILAFVRNAGQGLASLYTLRFDDEMQPAGKPELVSLVPVDFTGLAWQEDGEGLIYSAGRLKDWQLWRVGIVEPGPPEFLDFAGSGVRYPSVSNNRLVFQKREVDYNIYRLDLDESGGPVGTPQAFLSSSRFDAQPRYSPDGERVALISERDGRYDLYVSDPDGANIERMIRPDKWLEDASPTFGVQVCLPNWSPDGKWIAFEVCREDLYEIYVLSAEGGTPRRLASGDFPSWSPDSRWVYFIAGYGGEQETRKIPVAGGDSIQVDEVEFGRSHDGEWRYFACSRENRYWKQPVRGGQHLPLNGLTGDFPRLVKNKIYTLKRVPPGQFAFQAYDIETEETKVILLEDHFVLGFSVSPDGRSILYDRLDWARIDIMMMENFQ